MLPSPNLDDRDFEQIVREARRAIPKWLPEWTDENMHDPGITMLEMFAWISEMQQYYMNRVPAATQLKFLKLLGFAPQLGSSAGALVQFGNVSEPLVLPAGTKLKGQDQLYETTLPIRLSPVALQRIIVRTEQEANDYTSTNENAGVSYYAFGSDALQASRMYLALDRELAAGDLLTMAIKLFDDDPVEAAPVKDLHAQVVPSARVSWKYYGVGTDGKTAWLPVEVLTDETLHMAYSGKLALRVPGEMRPVMVHPANDQGRYWICCTVEEAGYECPPRVEQITFNAVQALQRDTHSALWSFDSSGEGHQAAALDHYLSRYGKLRVQVREQSGRWRYWREVRTLDDCAPHDRCYTAQPGSDGMRIGFGDGEHGAIPERGSGQIRLIAHLPEFGDRRMIGRSNGLPGQSIAVYDIPLQSGRFKLQVGVPIGSELLWEDWEQVSHFDASAPEARHFVFDARAKSIRFGNNERGAIPSQHDEPNLCLIACEFGGGERGNVKPGLITAFVHPEQHRLGLNVNNPFFAAGGTEPETLQDCIARAQRTLTEPFRAVTAEDVERIVRQTPGLKVAKVKALPMYTAGMREYPKERAPGQLTVAVVPFGYADTPMPSAGFMQTIKRHLDERRLITTEVHVIPPEYIRISIHATVVVEPYFVDEAASVRRALRQTLKPLDGPAGAGWSFGRTVHRGDLLGIVSRIKGVAFIQELWIEAEGRGWTKTSGGDIMLPPNGLVHSGDHEIELMSRTDM
ncbi:putative baseplate assembly protein [Paenibacillus sp. IB182496]|uniref:Baseplate assembly protein n=1 Tax=Paenibacillus sabuli TaxID=2772509 RepID=A0A927BW12_9BACL|nr:putative baseplate assembly protein [Paenibacillus sabuli]MBD2847886.1 putative baseplate assembly protein [Paenibacillus sabuli]